MRNRASIHTSVRVVLMLLGWPSQASAETLSLEGVLSQWRSSHTHVKTASADERLNAARDQADAYLAERRDFQVSGTFEQSLESTEDQSANREVAVGLSRRFVMFPSTQNLIEMFDMERRAEQFELLAEVRQSELQLARVFVSILKSTRTYHVLEDLERELAPHVAAAERASRMGGLSHLAYRRWQLLQQTFIGERETALARINASLAFLSRRGAFASGNSSKIPDVRSLTEVATLKEARSVTAELNAAKARKEAAATTVTNALNRREVTLSVEYKKSLVTSDERSILAGIALPLDGGLVRSSTAKEAEANLKTATQRLAIQTMVAEQELEEIKTRVLAASRSIQISESRLSKTRELYRESLQGFKRGQVEFAEVVESLKELHESEMALIEFKSEADEATVSYLSLTNQGPFANPEVAK